MFNDTKNIVAVATSPSVSSALNVVRCSGKEIFSIYRKITQKSSDPKPNSAFMHKLFDQNNQMIDQAVVLGFVAPKSFTGENMIEFSLHGGNVVLKNLIDCLVNYGCRLADPGEFTYRAFLNGKVDLIQAESINALIRAQTNNEAFLALNNISGALSKTITLSANKIVSIISSMEHELDFNDSEIDFIKQEEYIKQIDAVVENIRSLLGSSFVLSASLSHITVCFAGKTNVGKSSLFNALLGNNRAIISSTAGTTRDVVSENFQVNKSNVRLVDTAGIRKTLRSIEKKGIAKTNQEIKRADLLLFVDSKSPKNEFKKLKIKHPNVLFILNKQDAAKKQNTQETITTSCKTGFGVNLLLQTLTKKLSLIKKKQNAGARFLLNIRQKKELLLFIEELLSAVEAYKKTKDLVVVLSFLYNARNIVNSTMQPLEKDEVLNNIFGEFCVGK